MTTSEVALTAIHALMVGMRVPTYEIFAWRLANALVLGVLSWRVGFPNAQPGRPLPKRVRVARTIVAAMAGATSAAILLGIYGLPFEVVLNTVYMLAACLKGGQLSAFTGDLPGAAVREQDLA
ncbi:hypothetical protein [Paraburkholderia sacchari]|uniref:hypothetical protein n=1 Tax=Paraburkholderia sacchari TaxID=159450 RepID=UPI001BCF1876|nr:hypothetical protein [Paraburkholderia sacchari]